VKTHATMFDNPHLPEHIKQALLDTYEGTSLGAQELYGRIIDQDENALWDRTMIDDHRLKEAPPLKRITVGVDPSGGRGEQGIVVGGKALQEFITDGRKRMLPVGYTLADATCRLSPAGWGKRAVQTAVEYEAADICVEINYGGDMAIDTIRTAAAHLGVSIPVRIVRASRGKRVRAEPIAALYSQGRWHHVGVFEALEDQMVTWYPELDWSPDRLDANVWTGHHNKLVSALAAGNASFGGGEMASRVIG
jgi:phage terminase large subunit-like protein